MVDRYPYRGDELPRNATVEATFRESVGGFTLQASRFSNGAGIISLNGYLLTADNAKTMAEALCRAVELVS